VARVSSRGALAYGRELQPMQRHEGMFVMAYGRRE
jgi:hypothetical protein